MSPRTKNNKPSAKHGKKPATTSKKPSAKTRERPTQPYDNGLKRLVTARPQDWLNWLVPGATFCRQLSENQASLTLITDTVLEVSMNGRPGIVHIEFQSGPDADMDCRLLEYATLLYRKYRCKTMTNFVIYLRPDAKPEAPV